jgi:uncharacterized protein with PIN domain
LKPPEPFTWFVDRALGRRLAQELRAAGWKVEIHDDHFEQDAEDTLWLADVGRLGWVVLTKDKAIRRNAKVLHRFAVPLTASVTSTGHVTVLMAEGEILTPPKQIK